MAHATGNSKAHIPVKIGADRSHLSETDQKMIGLLIAASKHIDRIYIKQTNQESLQNGVFDNTRGNNFYPHGMTADSLLEYIKAHPDQESELRSTVTVVTESHGSLTAVPYANYYAEEMLMVAALLDQAAALASDEALRRFLVARAEAFRTNNFKASDIAWIHTNGPIEVTIGPYESYADELLGVKRTFEAIIGVVLTTETEQATVFQKYIKLYDEHLGQRYGYLAKTAFTPMVVMDEVGAAGEALYDYIAMAYNLPNDADIHEEVGSKKVFVRNVMKAKFTHLTKAIAKQVLLPEDLDRFSMRIYLEHVIGHEASHGLSVRFEGADFGPIASALEECKADVFGMWFLYYQNTQDAYELSDADTAVIQNITDGLRQIRFGVEEAHGKGALIQFNWFIYTGALIVSEAGFSFDRTKFQSTLRSLCDELYALAFTKNKDKGNEFFARWGRVPKSIAQLLPRLENIPVDIDPIYI